MITRACTRRGDRENLINKSSHLPKALLFWLARVHLRTIQMSPAFRRGYTVSVGRRDPYKVIILFDIESFNNLVQPLPPHWYP